MEEQGLKIKEAWENLLAVLPQWARDKANLFLLADQELVLHQAKNYPVHIKKVRCTNCGDCCFETPPTHTPFGSTDGVCNILYKNHDDRMLCGAGNKRPFKCLADPRKQSTPNCDIRYF